jgi:hypothetical protein
LYVRLTIQHIDDKDYRTMNGASQHQLSKDVKEDLKRILLLSLKKYQAQ